MFLLNQNNIESLSPPGPPTRALTAAQPQVPGGHGVLGAAGALRRRLSRPAGRGQELPAAAPGEAAHAGAEDTAEETAPKRWGLLSIERYFISASS